MTASRIASAPGGIRTPDFCLRRAALYPLSYRRVRLSAGYQPAACGTTQPGHRDVVHDGGRDHQRVEDLVEAEDPRPRVRAAGGVDRRADR